MENELDSLKEAFEKGEIDQDTFESMKKDLGRSRSSFDQETAFVKGRIHLDATGGATPGLLNSNIRWKVKLDGEEIGEGSLREGINLKFETTIGPHNLEIKELVEEVNSPLSFMAKHTAKGTSHLALNFDQAGFFTVTIGYNNTMGFLKKFIPSAIGLLPSKVVSVIRNA